MVLDTGSSDPWIITPGFQCVDLYSGDLEDEDYCYFGPVYDSTQSSTYVPIADENINLSYADGEFMTGSMGYEIFSMGGITVPSQQFGLVNYAGWLGDGVSSGLIGFAYSTITSAYAGTDPTQDQPHHTLQYNTLFTNMWNESLVAPVFSLALDRDPNSGGVLALGGIPNIPHTPYWVSTPIQSVGVLPGTNTLAYEYYTVESDGFAVSGEPNAQFGPVGGSNPAKTPLMEPGAVVVDSGTSVLYAPNTVADAFAAAFDPPATIDNDSGMYDCDCMGTPPVFGVSIGEKVFYVNPVDLIVQTGEDTCISGVQPNNGGLTILGDVWMKNVIAVHDIGGGDDEIRGEGVRYFDSQWCPGNDVMAYVYTLHVWFGVRIRLRAGHSLLFVRVEVHKYQT